LSFGIVRKKSTSLLVTASSMSGCQIGCVGGLFKSGFDSLGEIRMFHKVSSNMTLALERFLNRPFQAEGDLERGRGA